MADIFTTTDTTLYDQYGNPILVVDDGANKRLGVDAKINGEVTTVTEEHEAIHNGNAFTATSASVITVNSNSNLDILIKTPDSAVRCHLRDMSVNVNRNNLSNTIVASLNAQATVSANGTAITPFNNNRNSTTTPTTLFYQTPTITTLGDTLLTYLVHSDWETYIAPSYTTPYEIILKQNTNYIFRVRNNMNQPIDMTWIMFFYEL